MSTRDFLVEIGTEELPPKALANLSKAFTSEILSGLKNCSLASPIQRVSPHRADLRCLLEA